MRLRLSTTMKEDYDSVRFARLEFADTSTSTARIGASSAGWVSAYCRLLKSRDFVLFLMLHFGVMSATNSGLEY
jgi:hypothetical protein